MREPEYYDSQAAAAARLRISIYEIRNAKACGCTAFRSGRVYREELLAWLKQHPPSGTDQHDDEPLFTGALQNWNERREMIFAVGEFLDNAFQDGEISAADYRRIGDKTTPLLIQLSKIWNAGIDGPGYLGRWAELHQESHNPRKLTSNAGMTA